MASADGSFMPDRWEPPAPGSKVEALMVEAASLEAFGEAWVASWLQAPWTRYTEHTISTLERSKELLEQQIPGLLNKHGVFIIADKGTLERATRWAARRKRVA